MARKSSSQAATFRRNRMESFPGALRMRLSAMCFMVVKFAGALSVRMRLRHHRLEDIQWDPFANDRFRRSADVRFREGQIASWTTTMGRKRRRGGRPANHAFGSAGDTQSDPLPGREDWGGPSASRMPPCSRPSRTLRAAKTRCPSGLLDRRSARRLWNAQVGTKKRSIAV